MTMTKEVNTITTTIDRESNINAYKSKIENLIHKTTSFNTYLEKNNIEIAEDDVNTLLAEAKKFLNEECKEKNCYVTIIPEVKDTRKRPYKETEIKIPHNQKWNTAFMIVPEIGARFYAMKEGEYVKEKSDAMRIAKEFVTNNQMGVEIEKVRVKDEGIVGTLKYTPSKGYQLGKYLIKSAHVDMFL